MAGPCSMAVSAGGDGSPDGGRGQDVGEQRQEGADRRRVLDLAQRRDGPSADDPLPGRGGIRGAGEGGEQGGAHAVGVFRGRDVKERGGRGGPRFRAAVGVGKGAPRRTSMARARRRRDQELCESSSRA